jgi:hypothetical protein
MLDPSSSSECCSWARLESGPVITHSRALVAYCHADSTSIGKYASANLA